MNDCLNTTAQAHTPDKLSPYERLYKKRPNNRLLPFMMPGFRHHNRKNKAESKGERCFFLNSGNNHSSTTDKILLPSGIASYSADVTWGYRRRPFVGELPTWGGGAVVDLSVEPAVAGSIGGSVFPAASAGMMAGAPAAAGTRGAASAPAVAGSIGGSVFPAASAGMMTGAPAAAGTRGAASAPAVAGSIGGSVFPAASAGMMAGAPAAAGTRGAASAPAVAGSIGGSVFPAASAGMMAGAPAAAGTRGAASAPAVAGSIGGSVFPAASAGMMAGAPAAAGTRGAASAPAVAGSIGGSVFPAASAGMMAGAPTAAGTRGATTSAPVVASGSGGNVFPAESAGMMAGTPAAAGWNGAAFQAASSAVRPLPAVALASDDHEDWQVRRTATATRRQAYEVTPAMTRSGSRSSSRQDGVSGAFAALTMGEETVRTLDKDDGELPAGPAHLLVTPETYAQAHAGPHSRIWTKAESKEFEGLLAVGTFVEEGGI